MTDKNLLVITPHRKEPGKQRIAAYCRVSSRSDEQLSSLTNQIDFTAADLRTMIPLSLSASMRKRDSPAPKRKADRS